MHNDHNLRQKLREYKRTPGSFILMLLVMLCAAVTFAVLFFLIAYILINGVPNLKPELFAWTYTSENASMMPSIINTLVTKKRAPNSPYTIEGIPDRVSVVRRMISTNLFPRLAYSTR